MPCDSWHVMGPFLLLRKKKSCPLKKVIASVHVCMPLPEMAKSVCSIALRGRGRQGSVCVCVCVCAWGLKIIDPRDFLMGLQWLISHNCVCFCADGPITAQTD